MRYSRDKADDCEEAPQLSRGHCRPCGNHALDTPTVSVAWMSAVESPIIDAPASSEFARWAAISSSLGSGFHAFNLVEDSGHD